MKKYNEIKTDIIEKINSGELKPGDMIMSRHLMMKHYGVSITTVCKALDELKNEGFIYAHHGKGAFVTDKFSPKDFSKRKSIAVIIPDMAIGINSVIDIQTSNIAPLIVHHLSMLAPDYNSDIILYISNGNSDTEAVNIQNAISRKVDGMIIYPCVVWKIRDILPKVEEANIPYVMLDNFFELSKGSFVATDHLKGAKEATDYILDNFTENIYHITVTGGPYSLYLRKYGYIEAMEERNLPLKMLYADYPETENDLFNDFYAITMKNIDLFREKCAITTTNAYMMYGIYSALMNSDINMSRIAISCFDKMAVSVPSDMLFVNVFQDLETLSKKSLDILIGRIQGVSEEQKILIPPVVFVNKDNKQEINGDYIHLKDYNVYA